MLSLLLRWNQREPELHAWKGKEGEEIPAPMAVAPWRRSSARVANGEGPQEASFINTTTAAQRGPVCTSPWRSTGAARARRSRAGARKPSLGMGRARPRQAGKGESSRRGGGIDRRIDRGTARHGGGSRRTLPESGGDGGGDYESRERGDRGAEGDLVTFFQIGLSLLS